MSNLVIPKGSWSDLEDELLGPACDRDSFQTSQSWLGRMREYFRANGLNFEKAVRVLTNHEIEKHVRSMASLVVGGKWLFVMSSNMVKMASIVTALSIVYSLSTRRKSCVTTTAKIMDLYTQPWRKDEDSLIQHEAVGGMEVLKSCGLLIWLGINAAIPGGVKFSGVFDSILSPHTQNRKSVVFIMPCRKGSLNKEKILGAVASSVGDPAVYYITNYAKFLYLGEN